MVRSSLVAAQLADSQEGLSSMSEWIIILCFSILVHYGQKRSKCFEWPRGVLFIMKFVKWPREPIMTAVFDEIHNQFPNMTEMSWRYRLCCFTVTFNAILVITYVGSFTGHCNGKQNIPNAMDKPWGRLLISNRINFKWIVSKWMVKQLLVFTPARECTPLWPAQFVN
jgi:hypothetical protein